MRGRWLLVGIPVWIIASAAIAYGLVFLTPWFGAQDDFGSSYSSRGRWVTDSATPYTDYIDTYTLRGVRELAKLQPEEFQKVVEDLFGELVKLSEAQLSMLSAAGDDVCLSSLVDCQDVPGKNVKPFVEKALAHKQAMESVAIARRSIEIAAGGLDTSRVSLVVSIVALLVSFAGFAVAVLTYLRKKSAKSTSSAPASS